MRILALDVGTKRIGMAVSDPLGLTAQGLGVLERRNLEADLKLLRRVIEEKGVTSLLLGLPRNMNGTLGEKAREVQEFGDMLAREFGLAVEYQDERLSTKAVEGTLIAADVSRRKRRQVVDKLAAVFILQGYLDRKGSQNNRGSIDKEME
ncbi:MAG: Holliday junction resolvase RuvX [Syntrophomonadaceae bacterium]|nr:Holliday junction resolvase RuvX [Syntrophomonadaceae bacterium]